MMIVIGLTMTSLGYVLYAFSWSFTSIVSGFILIGFFIIYLNAGVITFYQNNVQVEMMGRVTSIYDFIQSVLQIISILAVGLLADFLSLRGTIIALALTMVTVTIIYASVIYKKGYEELYIESN